MVVALLNLYTHWQALSFLSYLLTGIAVVLLTQMFISYD